jgi:hypothetical protein
MTERLTPHGLKSPLDLEDIASNSVGYEQSNTDKLDAATHVFVLNPKTTNEEIWLTSNATWNGVDWRRESESAPAWAVVLSAQADLVRLYRTGAGSGAITWSEVCRWYGSAIALPDGTAAAPSHTFVSDLDTGLYRPAADVLGAVVGGTERARFIAGGSGLQLQADPEDVLQATTKQYADTKVAKAGDTMTGPLTLSGDPTSELHAAPKQYVDSKAYWRLLHKGTPGTSVTTYSITGLSITAPALLRLGGQIHNPSSTLDAVYRLRVNGEANSADWSMQYIWGNGTSVGGARSLDDSQITQAPANGRGLFEVALSYTANQLSGHSRAARIGGADSVEGGVFVLQKNSGIVSITQIDVVASITGGIGSSSFFVLEALI